MTSATKEYCVGIGMLIIAVVGWFVVIPAGIDLPSSVEFRALSPDFWPHVVRILLGICGAIVAVQAHFDRQRVGDSIEAATEEEERGEVQFEFAASAVRVVGALAGLFAAYFAIPHIGIAAAGVVLILASTFVLGERRLKYTVPLAIILPVILYMFFVHVANIPMPLGVFEAFR